MGALLPGKRFRYVLAVLCGVCAFKSALDGELGWAFVDCLCGLYWHLTARFYERLHKT